VSAESAFRFSTGASAESAFRFSTGMNVAPSCSFKPCRAMRVKMLRKPKLSFAQVQG
jgi:hypothetical protein